MVNFAIIDRAVRSELSKSVSDEQLKNAIACAILSALMYYDQELEKSNPTKKNQ